jgi:hypothetical protein
LALKNVKHSLHYWPSNLPPFCGISQKQPVGSDPVGVAGRNRALDPGGEEDS